MSTPHFVLSYSDATEPFVQDAARIAEETRSSLTEYFGDWAEPRIISIVLSDDSDTPNGGALVTDPVVYIDCRKTQMLLRGEADWLTTVITHELSHQYSLRLQKRPPLVNWFQGFSSAEENFAFTFLSTPSPIELPQWFVEGMAQMGSRHVGADGHDSVRQMVLRDAFQHDLLLSLDEMKRFEGTSRDAELVYNQGFSFLIFLETTKKLALKGLCEAIPYVGFGRAFSWYYGETLSVLYSEWRNSLQSEFGTTSPDTGTRLTSHQGPMVVETSSNSDGSLIIANWDNDYSRFGLFRKTPGGYEAWARDTGLTLKPDSRGGAWFTKLSYDLGRGASTFEVFHANDGKVTPVTSNSRVIAFDVLDGHLAYARYNQTGTEVVVRRPDGSETLLGKAPVGTAVYSLSLTNPGTAVVSLGTGAAVRLAILADGQWKTLWPGAEVMDVVSAGEDRLVFVSTMEGNPRLYWADLVQAPERWYRIGETNARFPAWESTNSVLTYSEYSKGGWYRHVLKGSLPTAQPVDIRGPLFGTVEGPPRSAGLQQAQPSGFNLVAHSEPLLVAWQTQRQRIAGLPQTASIHSITLGWQAAWYSAPRDWELTTTASLFEAFLLAPTVITIPQTELRGTLNFSLGPTRNTLGLTLTNAVTELKPGVAGVSLFDAYAKTSLQVAADQVVTADYDFQWAEDLSQMPALVYHAVGNGGLRWSMSDTPVSVFDPAGLGQSGFGAFLEGRVLSPYLMHPRYWDASILKTDTSPVETMAGGLGFNALLFDSRLALGGSAQALGTLGAVDGGHYYPWALASLGGSSWFSGYPSTYAAISRLATAALALKSNPSVNKSDKTTWYERLNLGVQIEAGAGQYFDPEGPAGAELRPAFPVSVEVSFSGSVYGAVDHASTFSLRFAMALNDFVGDGLNLPFQIYGSYLY